MLNTRHAFAADDALYPLTQMPGGATINVPAGSLGAGSDTLTVSYTPDQASSSAYTAGTAAAVITVKKAKPAINWSDLEAIVYGTALSSKQLDASARSLSIHADLAAIWASHQFLNAA